MKEINPTQSPVAPVVTPQVIVEQPKTNNFLVILLSVLLFISVSIAGFFAYQTQKLVKELQVMRIESEQKPVATTEPTAEPVATNNGVSADPTANWMTYTSIENEFSFKYPSDWKVQNGIPNSGLISLETVDGKRFFTNYHQSYSIQEWLDDTQSGKIVGKKNLGIYTFTIIKGGAMVESLEYAIDARGKGIIRFVLEPNTKDSESEKVLNEILSTFKFTN